MIERTEYLKRLETWKNTQLIKVITGIRRCGKSTLLQQFQDRLRTDGIQSANIISINFEDLEYEDLLDYKALYHYIKERLVPDQMTYVFFDEIQRVAQFEKAIDSLYIQKNTDIYITGSNSFMLSGELATLLSGRYIEIELLPLSFGEFYSKYSNQNMDEVFAKYMISGGFPYLTEFVHETDQMNLYLDGIYNTVIVKDIEDREKRKIDTKRRISDFSLLRNIARFLASSVGSPISTKSITNFITSSGREISQNTVAEYLEILKEAYVFYDVNRFDISGKQLMKTNQKFYIVDVGLRRYLLPRKSYDIGFTLENIVFLELLKRGYQLNTGKAGNTEVDFIARKNDLIIYIQVTASLIESSTFEREIKPLQSIKDNHPKYILTLDRFTAGNYDGIVVQNVVDWLVKG